MQVGLIIYGSLDLISGGYIYDQRLVQHLEGRGDRVLIVPLPWRSYPLHLLDNLSGRLVTRLRSLDVDILLEDELNHPSLVWANRRLKGAGYPIISIVHNLRSLEARPAWQQALYRAVEQLYLRSVDGFVFNSQATRQSVVPLLGPGQPWIVAEPCGDRLGIGPTDDEVEARARQEPPLRVLFVANVTPGKGLHVLLDALEMPEALDVSLTVAGSLEIKQRYARAMQARVSSSSLAGRVRFTGLLGPADLAAEMRRAQVLCVPSYYEGFGMCYLEGMGFGLPAIATTAGGAREIVSHGQEGFLLSPGDTDSLAGYLQLLNRDRELLAQMGIAARQRFLAHPSWQETGDRIRRFLLQLAEGHR